MDKANRYFFKTRGGYGDEECTEECNVKGGGTKIGSIKCQHCEFCKDYDKTDGYAGPNWIECSVLEIAKGVTPKEKE